MLEKGWGLFLGKADEQRLELEGKLDLIEVKVRFFPTVIDFILEGELRHPKQELEKGPIDSLTGKFVHVDYIVKLPPRSLQEFSWWGLDCCSIPVSNSLNLLIHLAKTHK